MNLAELLADEAARQREFPVVREKTFLAHAGDCPLPARVAEAVAHYARQAATGDQEQLVYPAVVDEARELASRLIRCQPDEVALVGPTSLALSFIASGLKFRRGENVLICFDDYPANVYPWMALAEQGVEVRLMNTRGLGLIRPRDVIGQVDENTRLVALASAHFLSGYRLDVAGIGRELHRRNILFCLDAIQTLGAFPLDTEHIDLLAADAHKWLLGPCGAGLLYVRRAVQDRLNPPIYGWNNVLCPDYVAQESLVRQRGARKYEAGTYNLLGLSGLTAALRLVLELGVENIAAALLQHRARLVPALQAKGYTVLHAEAPPENCSGITTFYRPGEDLAALQQKLAAAGIVVSLRADRAGRQYLRLSPHYYNTEAELQRALDLL